MLTNPSEVLRGYWRPYQQDWIYDRSRRRRCVKARQVGITWSEAFRVALRMLTTMRQDTFYISTNFANAKSFIRRVRYWLEALRVAGLEFVYRTDSTTVLEVDSFSRVVALPCTAAAVRSNSGHFILDEAAHYADDRNILQAAQPAMEAVHDYTFTIFSSPYGDEGLFYDVMHDARFEDWSIHHVDIHRAVADGLEMDIESMRSGYTSDQWAQEFECSFEVLSEAYLPPSLVKRVQFDPDGNVDGFGSLVQTIVACDVGGSSDPAALLTMDEYEHGVIVRDHKLYTDIELTPLRELIEERFETEQAARVIVDATGEGSQIGQDLRRKYRGKAVAQKFTKEWKGAICPGVKRALEQGKWRQPHDDRLRRDFGRVRQVVSESNNILYKTKRDQTGHGDLFWAAALAYSCTNLYAQKTPSARQTRRTRRRTSKLSI